MKLLLSLPIIFLLSFSNKPLINDPKSSLTKDTTFKHVLDGKPTEWPSQKFEMDASTGIKYAVDNDEQDLYLALLIPDQQMQLKIMRQGMDLYIDLKGKRKEGKGIEFPVKRDPNASDPMMSVGNTNNEDPSQQTPEQRKARMKAMKATMALNLVAMKVFGFSSNEPEEQGLLMPGSANVAFAWDSTDVMCIEYKIPISLISPSPMNQKDVSVGWKINGFQRPTHPASTESEGNHNRGGGRGGYGGGYGGQNRSSEEFENFMKDQSFWTKYTFK